ncbi:MAG: erythromycin esterase family protein, partial [Nannocystaceae bacterium]
PPPPATITGRVLDDAGRPVAGAVVAAFQPTGANETLQTDERGQFSLQMTPGELMVGAGGPGGVAGAQGVVLRPGANEPLTLTLAKGPQRIHGTVTDQHGRPYAGATALVATDEEHAYPIRTGQDGTWSLEVPAAEQYMAMIIGEDGQRVMAMIDDPDAALASTLNREGAAPAAAVEWIREHHVPLRTVEAGHGLQDLAALDPMLADATVVGLGEATHGTREFFQLKHRMLEYLVERHGFTVFGIEANRTECRAIDHYVRTGQGDPKEALDGIYFWTWNTQEVLALIEWMRAYNESHETTLHFVGFDAQTPDVAARNVDAFLAQVDPQAPQREALQRLGGPFNHEVYEALSLAEREALATALAELADRFDREGDRLATAGSETARVHAREDLKVVQQVVHMRNAPGMESFAARDRAMADNVLHLTERYGKDAKAVLWAHNGHVARSWIASDTMGKYLADALGPRYVSVGFAFDHGGFQAIGIEGEQWTGLREHTVGPAGGSDIEATLRLAGPELFALPLRELPTEGDAAQWLRSPLPMRQIGAGFSADDMSARVVESIPDKYDLLMFVEQTSRARPVSRD